MRDKFIQHAIEGLVQNQHIPDMDRNISADITAEKTADWASYKLIAAFVCLSWITLSTSSQIDARRIGSDDPALLHWLTQLTSHIVILGIAIIIPRLLNLFPMSRESWLRSLTGFGLGFLCFGVVHVLGMVALRNLIWPIAFGAPYDFGLANPWNWFYELQKDAYSFLLLTSIFWLGRHHAHQRLEVSARQEEARESGRLTLMSGGRIYLIKANDVRVASSAANYVEILTPKKNLLVRMTLRELENLLGSVGDNHIRIHRSCLVHKDGITGLKPNGDGSASIELTNGKILQVSRTYRSALNAALLS